MKEEGYKEIYQRIKKENPCIFCIRSDGGCQFKGNECDLNSLKKYHERNQLEIESILKDIYIKELDQENEQLKQELKNTFIYNKLEVRNMQNEKDSTKLGEYARKEN